MKPWDAEVFEWNDGNLSELADHQIRQAEVEELFQSRPQWVPNKKHRSGDWKMVGYTDGGRAITVVVSFDEVRASLRPITGWDCDQGERTKYLKG